MAKINYKKLSGAPKYEYELLADATIYTPTVNYGKWCACSKKDPNQVIISANGHYFTVHAGYTWDGCTCAPDCDWNIRASLFHDAMYQTKKQKDSDVKVAEWSEIDRIFRQIMKEDGANLFQRNLYYYAVRTFGSLWRMNKLDTVIIK